MSTINFSIERELPCPCLSLAREPFPKCPECGGTGTSWQEIELAVEYGWQRPYRGARDSYGAPLEPDDPGGGEILSVTDANGREWELSSREEDRLYERIEEDVCDRHGEALIARWEARHDF
jgi:hypothetical protein